MVLKFDAVLGDFAQLRERENLVSAAIGEDRPVPIHEFMQAAKMFDYVQPRPDEQMIRVAENDLRIQLAQFSRAYRLYAALRSDRHERRRFNRAMCCH